VKSLAACTCPSTTSRARLRRNRAITRSALSFRAPAATERAEYGVVRVPSKPPESAWSYLEAQKEFDRRLLSQYAPATVFVNEDLEIIHSRGNVNRYLKLAPGRASLSISKMAREGLLTDLRNAISQAKKENVPVRRQNIQIKNGGNGNGEGGREVQVVRFLADGMSNKQIASALNLSIRTVETYRSRLMAKLKIHSAAEIVRYAIRNNLIQA
jgi:DNA-binding CsgD family transcriptional regulator